MIPFVLLCAFIGLIVNMSFAGLVTQPDWAMAILLAVLLSNRHTWFWVLPMVWLHDLLLFWSAWVSFPYFLSIAFILFYTDERIGSGQQQRWFSIFLANTSLWIAGINIWDLLLTVMLSIWLWFLLSAKRERDYVEPA